MSKEQKVIVTVHAMWILALALFLFKMSRPDRDESHTYTFRHHYQEYQLIADPPMPLQRRS